MEACDLDLELDTNTEIDKNFQGARQISISDFRTKPADTKACRHTREEFDRFCNSFAFIKHQQIQLVSNKPERITLKNGARDLTNMKVGHLTVLYPIGKKNRYYLWLCRCDCSNEVQRTTCSLCYYSTENTSCGCAHPNKKLSPENVITIKSLLHTRTNVSLAQEYGVDPTAISLIRCNKNWDWIV